MATTDNPSSTAPKPQAQDQPPTRSLIEILAAAERRRTSTGSTTTDTTSQGSGGESSGGDDAPVPGADFGWHPLATDPEPDESEKEEEMKKKQKKEEEEAKQAFVLPRHPEPTCTTTPKAKPKYGNLDR